MEETRKQMILRMDSKAKSKGEIEDTVAVEAAVHIVIQGIHYATILCTPANLRELVVGHLLSEGIVDSTDEIRKMDVGDDLRCSVMIKDSKRVKDKIAAATPFARIILTGCGSTSPSPFHKLKDRLSFRSLSSRTRVRVERIAEAISDLNTQALTFRKTGGVHAACLCYVNGGEITLAEDVGRHNAVDKVIGMGALEGCNFSESFLASTGRLSGDIVLKAARVGVPLLASITSALSSGIDMAEATGVTLIGFVRGGRMNIYTHPERLEV